MKNSMGLFLKMTHDCNLRCTYCYDKEYFGKRNIDEQKMKKLIDMAARQYKHITIMFHGGEPLVLGRQYYLDLVKFIEKTHPGVTFKYSMQTNGTLLDEETRAVLRACNISFGVSYDGLAHDECRSRGEETLSNIQAANEEGYNTGIITVANETYLGNIIDEYYHLKNTGIKNARINWVKEDRDHPYTAIYIEAMKKLLDHWTKDQHPLSITQFEGLLQLMQGRQTEHSLACLDCHEKWIGMDYDGLLGPCDFGIYPREFNFGHIDDFTDINDIVFSEKRLDFLKQVTARYRKCFESDCPLQGKCSGGCNGDIYREFGTLSEINGQTCEILRSLYTSFEDMLETTDKDKLNPIIKDILYKK